MSHCTACCAALLFASAVCGRGLVELRTDEVLSIDHDLSISIQIDEGRDILELHLMGPADVYYAVGFGSNVMLNTWAVVVNGEGDDGWFEQTLSDHDAGQKRPEKSLELLQSTVTAQTNNMRRVHLKKALSSLREEHPFDTAHESIDIIWAIGSSPEFAGHTEFGTKTLLYDKMDAMSPHLPSDIWVMDGAINISALVVIVGMGAIFLSLAMFYGWKWYQNHQQKRREKEGETDPLLKHDTESNVARRHFVAL